MGTSSALWLPHVASSVAAARERVRTDLLSNGVTREAVEDAALVLSELAGNALRHARPLARGQVRVSWSANEDTIEVAVSDGGSATRPRRAPLSPTVPGGKGLGIVNDLAHAWGVRPDPDGMTVWAVLRLGELADYR